MQLPTITYTVGLPGAGKTYYRCARFLYDQFFVESKGILYTNFPIKVAEMCLAVAEKYQLNPDEIEKRIHLIPENVLKVWRSGLSGPWDYFKDMPTEGNHFSLDEIHNYCGVETDRKVQKRWAEWLGELRHQGMTAEFLTQSPAKVAKTINHHAERRLYIVKGESRRDPLFNIELTYWYNLKASFTGVYNPSCVCQEQRNVLGKWITSHAEKFRFEDFYFKLYDSFAKPQTGQGQGASGTDLPYQRFSKPKLYWWFFRNNFFRLMSRFLLGGFVFWMCFGGGLTYFISKFPGLVQDIAAAQSGKSPSVSGSASRPVSTSRPVTLVSTSRPVSGSTSQPASSQPADSSSFLMVRKAAEISALFPDSVLLGDGQMYRVGEEIVRGKYKGKKLNAIDYSKRRIRLDGDWFDLGD